MLEDPILSNLNPPQQEAVQHDEGPLLILAGAGSGKTRVITRRIAYLIARRGLQPWQILAVTFTNKAADEMKKRVEQLLGARGLNVALGTFHSTCVRILRKWHAELGFRHSFVIYDDADQLSLVKDCLKSLSLSERVMSPRAVAARISRAKNEMLTPGEYAGMAADFTEERTAKIYSLYQERLKASHAVDFDDLLMLTVLLFRDRPHVLEYYQNLWRYVLVDEYQDTNHAQYQIVNFLSRRHRNLCVVGDDDQGIYSWRGADLRNILEFEKDYPESKVVRLERNYRSTRVILEAANNVVSIIPGRKEKRLWTEREEGEPIRYFFANSGSDETAYVALEINRLLEGGEYGHRDFAVFYRTNAQSRPFEEMLLRFGIPYKIVGGFKFYERKEVKDALAYLKFLLNPDDAVSLRRIINEPKRGIGDTSLAHLEAFARTQGVGMWEALRRADEAPGLGAAARKKLAGFVELMEGLSGELERLPLPELLQAVLERSGYLDALAREGTFEAEGRAENLQELKNAMVEFNSSDPTGGLDAFLERVSLVAEIDLYDEDEGAVTLMTLHNAKGLEFPAVFIVGMEDGVFPHLRCMGSMESMEEERRLFYVGVTRARDRLYLTGAAYRSLYGNLKMSPESRFIRDIPRQHMEVIALEGPAAAEGTEDRVRLEELDVMAAAFRVGDSVVHNKFGEGVVTGLTRSRSGPEIMVNFPAIGEKLLLLEFAPLRKA